MKIEVEKKEFQNALEIGGMFSGKVKTNLSLNSIKFEFVDGKCRIYSSNSDNYIGKRFNPLSMEETEGCSFCVDRDSFVRYINECYGVLTLNFDDNEKSVTVTHDGGSASFPLMDSDSFPLLFSMDENETHKFTIKSNILCEWAKVSPNFISIDKLRPVINSMYLSSTDGLLEFCATDGRSLITSSVNSDVEVDNFEIVFDVSCLKAIVDITKDSETTHISYDKNIIKVSSNGAMLMVRGLDGKYPPFRRVIPNNNEIKAVINKKNLISSISRLNVIKSIATNRIEFDFKEDGLTLKSEDLDFSRKGSEKVESTCSSPIVIALNGDKIMKILSNVDTDNVIFEIRDSKTGVIIREDDEKSKKLIMLMPLIN